MFSALDSGLRGLDSSPGPRGGGGGGGGIVLCS